MSRALPWSRLDRDFDQDPALQALTERHPTSLVLAAYCITLASAARCDGIFASSDALERTLRLALRCKPSQATALVADFVASGILEFDGVALRLTKWHDLQPRERHLTRSQRVASSVASSVASGVERTNARTDERTNERTDAATQEVEWISEDTVRLPPKVEPTLRTVCSHGERFEERPGTDGRTFWSAGHRTADGSWCKEKR